MTRRPAVESNMRSDQVRVISHRRLEIDAPFDAPLDGRVFLIHDDGWRCSGSCERGRCQCPGSPERDQ